MYLAFIKFLVALLLETAERTVFSKNSSCAVPNGNTARRLEETTVSKAN